MRMYESEELLPIVAELADKYTGKESTSVTYEKARQLMGAVLYCIRENESQAGTKRELVLPQAACVRTDYNRGYELVIEKTRSAEKSYNQVLQEFRDYNNQCLYDTFVKGIPSFFLYYDPRFNPQDHFLTLDYPVLVSMEGLCGIDAMERYVKCIALEQIFLGKLPEEYVEHVLYCYEEDFRELIVNLAGIVIRDILGCKMAEKAYEPWGYTKQELKRVADYVNHNTREELENQLKKWIEELVGAWFDGNLELAEYLKADMENYSYELKNAVQNQCLFAVLPIRH